MQQASGVISFTAKASTADFVWTSVELARRSVVSQVLGSAMIVLPLPAIAFGMPADPFIIGTLAFGLSLLSGLFVVPFVAYAVRRRADLLLVPMEVRATTEGLDLKTPMIAGQQAWAAYRSAFETDRAFVLQTGAGGTGSLIAKRAVDPATLRAFRLLLWERNLVKPGATPADVAIRLAFGLVLGLVPFLLGISASSL